MQRWRRIVVAGGMALVIAGCSGDGMLRPQGRLLKAGKMFIPDDGNVQITFVPIPADGSAPKNHYWATVDDQKGTFVPAGGNKRGMPAGKYRVAIEVVKNKKDLLEGKYNDERSPYIFTVDASTREIVIDLDKPPAS